jgi:hypothetical protein
LSKKKIVIISPNYFPENFPINNFVDLLSKEEEVDIITNLPSYRINKFYKGYNFFGPYKEKIKGISIYRIPTFPRISDKKIFILFHYIIYFISMTFYSTYYFIINRKNTKYIISYCLSPTFTALFGIIGSKITGAKHYNWVQDIWPEAIISSTNIKNNFFYKIITMFQNFLFDKSELIAQSDQMKSYFESKYLKKINQINNIPRNLFQNQKISKNKIKDKLVFSYFGNIGKAQKLEFFLNLFMETNNKNFVVNIYGSGSEKNELMKKFKNEKIIWHQYMSELDLLEKYEETNYFLLPIDATGRQKYILPGKFSSYLFFCRPIIGFSNKNSAIEECIKNNQLGKFIDIDDNIEKNIKIINELFNNQKEYYETQEINAKNFYNNYFSTKSIEEQIKKTFI